ncbi:SRPBCC family protein [Euzebya rosea]|uniref:SRPBCC family protein n=1 Tax=Euzebya rosea TaxID=2052804 RepID=UPI000D3E176A|nr:SRPBCC family protein [Euzebya rosea]
MTDTLTASASAVVDAPADEVFAYICRPTAHPDISGDRSVRGGVTGPEQLSAEGDRFGMRMKMYGLPYRITSTVVEFEPGRRIAWCHPGRHRWRWEVEPLEDGRSKVTETFDMSTSPIKPALRLLGYPGAHQANVERSVANVARHFAD